jgi:hypothetical protein
MCCDYSSGGGWAERGSRGSSENLASPSIEDAPHRVVVLPPEKGSKPGTVLDLENQIKAITIDPSKSSSVDCQRVMKPRVLTSSMVLVGETNVGEQVAVRYL